MIGESLDSLPIGHYGVGITLDAEEVDIYRASASEIWNVATGLPVVSLSAWRRKDWKNPQSGPDQLREG